MKIKKMLVGLLMASAFFLFPKISQAGGYSVFESTYNTTFVQVATGSGYLANLVISSGTTGDTAVCYDSASITGLSLNTVPTNGTGLVELARIVDSSFTTNFANTNYPVGLPFGVPPIAFTNGLACAASSASDRVKYYYKSVPGIAAGTGSGMTAFESTFTTGGSLIATGAGTIYDIVLTSATTLNDAYACYDSATPVLFNAFTNNTTTFEVDRLVAPNIGTTMGEPLQQSPLPVNFTTGLFCVANGGADNWKVYYRQPS